MKLMKDEDWITTVKAILKLTSLKGKWSRVQMVIPRASTGHASPTHLYSTYHHWHDPNLVRSQKISQPRQRTGYAAGRNLDTLGTALAEKHGWITEEIGITIRKVLRRARINSIEDWCNWAIQENLRRPLTQETELTVKEGLKQNVGND
ncbi:hypothetical protein R1flu_022268 [Riccia fluitans]|uniref:Uncharacterized protein n=1 Tax=Riccia fluitans TaxID=41844 RepID=A0ABD1ZSQ4_9MARC